MSNKNRVGFDEFDERRARLIHEALESDDFTFEHLIELRDVLCMNWWDCQTQDAGPPGGLVAAVTLLDHLIDLSNSPGTPMERKNLLWRFLGFGKSRQTLLKARRDHYLRAVIRERRALSPDMSGAAIAMSEELAQFPLSAVEEQIEASKASDVDPSLDPETAQSRLEVYLKELIKVQADLPDKTG